MKPCLEAGCPNPATNGPRCHPHHLDRQRQRDRRRGARYTHAEREAMRACVADAYANPDTTCWLCNETLGGGTKGGWQADHVTPRSPTSQLRPAHARCNASRGNRPN